MPPIRPQTMLPTSRRSSAFGVPLRLVPLLGVTAAVIFVLVLVLQPDAVPTSPSPSFESAAGGFKLNRNRLGDFHLNAAKGGLARQTGGRQACGDSRPIPEMCNDGESGTKGGVARWIAQLGAGSGRDRLERACRWDNQREGYYCAPIGGEGDR